MAEKKPSRAERLENRRKARERFNRSKKAGRQYTRQLRAVAKHVDTIVKGFSPDGKITSTAELTNALDRYAQLIRPWAREVSSRMIEDVSRRDRMAWIELSQSLGRELQKELKNAPTGQAMKRLMAEQVELITSLPIEAARRVHKLTIEVMSSSSSRAKEISEEILKTGKVTQSRAMLIARTEVARTASAMTEVRAKYVGSEGYIWRTLGDSDVRYKDPKDKNKPGSHRKLEGKFIKWSDPPIAGPRGERAHAGAIYNCRCYPEPVIPDVI